MVFKIYNIEFTKECKKEIMQIYEYISKNLYSEEAAKRLMRKIKKRIMDLSINPRLYIELESKNKRKFRRMVIDNYIILYTIDEENKKVFISHMFYARRNYLYIL